jgi:hypothetical protein
MMKKPFQWTEDLDASLPQARTARMSWDEIAPKVGVCIELCVRRAKELNIPTARGASGGGAAARWVVRRLCRPDQTGDQISSWRGQ